MSERIILNMDDIDMNDDKGPMLNIKTKLHTNVKTFLQTDSHTIGQTQIKMEMSQMFDNYIDGVYKLDGHSKETRERTRAEHKTHSKSHT